MLMSETLLRKIVKNILLEVAQYKLGEFVELGSFTKPNNSAARVIGKEETALQGDFMYYVLIKKGTFNEDYFKSNPGQYKKVSEGEVDDIADLYTTEQLTIDKIKELAIANKIAKVRLGTEYLSTSSKLTHQEPLDDFELSHPFTHDIEKFERWINNYEMAKRDFPKIFLGIELLDVTGITNWPDVARSIKAGYEGGKEPSIKEKA